MTASPLIALDGVDVVLEGHRVLRDMHLAIREGECHVILGGNGSGKSTLLRLLKGTQWPAPESRGTRLYNFDGIAEESSIGARERIGLVSPEVQEQYLRYDWPQTAAEIIRCGFSDRLYLQEPLTPEQESRVAEVVALLGVEPLLERRPAELSQGEGRKVMIARALVAWPRVLLLDEVANGLDADSRAELLALLSRLARGGLTMVSTTHRASEILPEATHAMVLDHGAVVASGRPREVVGQWRRAFAPPEILPAPPRARPTSGNAFVVRDADVFVGETKILHRISLTIGAGEHWAILGRNGSGKTTFLKLLYGEHSPALGGSIRRFDFDDRTPLWRIREAIGYVGAELHGAYHYDVSALEAVLSGFFSTIGLYDETTEAQVEAARRQLAFFGLADRTDQRLFTLSHGQLRRVLLARAMVANPRVLLLDEPFNGLDPAAQALLAERVAHLAAAGTQIIVTTHHAEDLPPFITHAAGFAEGRLTSTERIERPPP